MAGAFNCLPIEINQKIAENICSDRDVASFRLICQSTNDALNGDRKSFWRRRFLDQFDKPAIPRNQSMVQINDHIYEKYKVRCSVLNSGISFAELGNSRDERNCLETLIELVIEAYSGANAEYDEEAVSKNLTRVNAFLDTSGLLQHASRCLKQARKKGKRPTRSYYAFILVFTQRFLCDGRPVYQFPICRQSAYAPTDETEIFRGFGPLQINMEWLLWVVSFWKYHLTMPLECTLHRTFADLPSEYRPMAWKKKLENGAQKLGRYWNGVYAHLEVPELIAVRSGSNRANNEVDRLNDDGEEYGFQMFEMLFPEAGSDTFVWEQQYDKILHSQRPPFYGRARSTRTRSQGQGQATSDSKMPRDAPIPFTFLSCDPTVEFESKGWLNALPTQQGIPGWQRITFMRYHIDHPTTNIWAYEGVVLPGNQIIVGRWWYPDPNQVGKNQSSGPFLFWNIDAATMPDSDEADDC